MTFLLQEPLSTSETYEPAEYGYARRSVAPFASAKGRPERNRIVAGKLTPPRFDGLIKRPRLTDLLSRSLHQCCATLITGRAGTGKTALAAEFAAGYSRAAWYSVDAADADWETFAMYFAAAVNGAATVGRNAASAPKRKAEPTAGDIAPDISQFLINLFTGLRSRRKPMLIVVDDLHRIFEAEWFADFFAMLVYTLPENVHLLLTCRSKPPSPLWRLRSKQMLNVIDEKLLAFDEAEARSLLAGRNIPDDVVTGIHAASFGRASKLVQLASLAEYPARA